MCAKVYAHGPAPYTTFIVQKIMRAIFHSNARKGNHVYKTELSPVVHLFHLKEKNVEFAVK